MASNPERPFSFEAFVTVNESQTTISRFIGLSDEIESLIETKMGELYEHIDAVLANSSGSDEEEIVESYGEDLEDREVRVPSMHRQSLFITLYGYFEFELGEISKSLGREVSATLEPRDLAGRGIYRYISYLEKVVGLDLSDSGKEIVNNLGKLRNRIVHNGGLLPNDPNDAVNHFVRSPENCAEGRPGRPVQLHKNFNRVVSEQLVQFLHMVETEMHNYMNRNA